jgi:N-acetylmuramoyl-L-alanine amidase
MYNANTKDRARTDFIAIHCSATSEKQNFGAADINKWHRAKGWACIGYHYVIKRDGTIEQGRKESQVGAHVADWNAVSLGICMIGGVDADDRNKAEDNFTPEQYASLKDLILELKTRYPKAKIQGHRDFPKVAKACPCFDVATWLKAEKI